MVKQSTKTTKKTVADPIKFEPNKMTFVIATLSVVVLFLFAIIVTRF
jgi:hypothetical protein